jgi:(+)-abscisic acid 8'-hydroxylase
MKFKKDPDAFNPHRFANNPNSRDFLPFGSGKHACPGQFLAKAESMLLVTHVLKNYSNHFMIELKNTRR